MDGDYINFLYTERKMLDMQEWLLAAYENEDLTKSELRTAVMDKRQARELWVEFCDSEDFVEDCQYQIERFLEMIDEAM